MIIDILLENIPTSGVNEEELIKQIIARVLSASYPALTQIINRYKYELSNNSAPNPNLWQRVKGWWNKFTGNKHQNAYESLELYNLVSPLNESYGEKNLDAIFKNLTNDIQKVLSKSLYSQLKVILPQIIKNKPTAQPVRSSKLVRAIADPSLYDTNKKIDNIDVNDESPKETLPPYESPKIIIPSLMKGKRCPECKEKNGNHAKKCKKCEHEFPKLPKFREPEDTTLDDTPPQEIISNDLPKFKEPESIQEPVKSEAPKKSSGLTGRVGKVKKIKEILNKNASDLSTEEESIFKDYVEKAFKKVLSKKDLTDDERIAIDLYQVRDALG